MCDERVCDGRLYKDERMYDERKGMWLVVLWKCVMGGSVVRWFERREYDKPSKNAVDHAFGSLRAVCPTNNTTPTSWRKNNVNNNTATISPTTLICPLLFTLIVVEVGETATSESNRPSRNIAKNMVMIAPNNGWEERGCGEGGKRGCVERVGRGSVLRGCVRLIYDKERVFDERGWVPVVMGVLEALCVHGQISGEHSGNCNRCTQWSV